MDLSTRFWGINPINSVVIPHSLVLKSIVLEHLNRGTDEYSNSHLHSDLKFATKVID